MVTGTDLVEWQLRVAQGEEVPVKQVDSFVRHFFEMRLYNAIYLNVEKKNKLTSYSFTLESCNKYYRLKLFFN